MFIQEPLGTGNILNSNSTVEGRHVNPHQQILRDGVFTFSSTSDLQKYVAYNDLIRINLALTLDPFVSVI